MNTCRKRTLTSAEATALALSAQAGDSEAFNKLAYRSRCLCKAWLARRWKWVKPQDREDMLGVAAVALVRCVRTYDRVRPFTIYYFSWVARAWNRWVRQNMKFGKQLNHGIASLDVIGDGFVGDFGDDTVSGVSAARIHEDQGLRYDSGTDGELFSRAARISSRLRAPIDGASKAVDSVELVDSILGKMEKSQADLIRIVYGIGEGQEPRRVRDLERSLGLGRNVLAERLTKAKAAFRQLAESNT